jgi:hypothetical protein
MQDGLVHCRLSRGFDLERAEDWWVRFSGLMMRNEAERGAQRKRRGAILRSHRMVHTAPTAVIAYDGSPHICGRLHRLRLFQAYHDPGFVETGFWVAGGYFRILLELPRSTCVYPVRVVYLLCFTRSKFRKRERSFHAPNYLRVSTSRIRGE